MALFVAPGEGPRGIWCVGSSPLILINAGGGSTIFQPKTAVDLLVAQGKEVEAKGVVTTGLLRYPRVGAVCSGLAGVSYAAEPAADQGEQTSGRAWRETAARSTCSGTRPDPHDRR